MMPDMSLDGDVSRPMVRRDSNPGQVYKNCLGYALRRRHVHSKYTKASSLHQLGMNDASSFAEVMTAALESVNFTAYRIVGTDARQSVYNAPAISKRHFIGVGKDSWLDLHYYVVTRTNGDGQGIAGVKDGENNCVLPCRLRGDKIIQFQNFGGTPTVDYKFFGWLEIVPP